VGFKTVGRREASSRGGVSGRSIGDSNTPDTAAVRGGSFPVVCWKMGAVGVGGKTGWVMGMV